MRERDSFMRSIDALQVQLRNIRSEVNYYEGDDEEPWPPDEPIPAELNQALVDAEHAIDAIETGIEKAKRDYRIRCLEWLLAKERNG